MLRGGNGLLVGRGVGQLRFGMTIDGIKALIGEPSVRCADG